MAKILVVEDDKDISQLVNLHLSDAGHDVDRAFDGLDAMDLIAEHNYDLIVLDLMLPEVDGLELCRFIREKKTHTLVLMLTAKSSEFDRVLGLEMGADDYLTKPFGMRELQARVKALLRRKELFSNESPKARKEIIIEDLTIKTDSREVSLAGKEIKLTAKEFDLLLQFAKHPAKVYTRTQLLDLVWGYGYEGFEHTVNSHINRLRSKIEQDPAKPKYILTVWGIGYKFASFN